jgi:hypothetical protein
MRRKISSSQIAVIVLGAILYATFRSTWPELLLYVWITLGVALVVSWAFKRVSATRRQ